MSTRIDEIVKNVYWNWWDWSTFLLELVELVKLCTRIHGIGQILYKDWYYLYKHFAVELFRFSNIMGFGIYVSD